MSKFLIKDFAKRFNELIDPANHFHNEAVLEVFAEKIITECMQVISDESDAVSGQWNCKDGQHIWWKIKTHFEI